MQARFAFLAVSLLTVASCGGNVRNYGPPSTGSAHIPDMPADPVPRPEPRGKYGNGPVYEVLGKRYTVMPSSSGYQERGVASWYGTKFHGNLTSSREPYDMYAMTAAHKTLPLPTYVRVRNLRNDRSIIVRVNDRGPFVHNRIIDLSYAAALKLDMVKDGTSMVEVTAINFDAPQGDRPTRISTPAEPPRSGSAQPVGVTHRIYVQVGAFGDRSNAERRLGVLSTAGMHDAFIHEERSPERVLFRVRIGPVADVVQYDMLVAELESIGITDPYLITE